MKLTFLGAAHEVTGSCTLLQANGKNILIDCGLEQGPDEYENPELPLAAGDVDAVLLTPTCCDPLCRRAARVSMGTVFQIPWTRIGAHPEDWPQPGLTRLQNLGFKTAALALSKESVSVDDPQLMAEEKLAIVLGTEGDGLAASTIAGCDYTVCIPMSHGVDSLNVAAASAVAFWEVGKAGRR